MHARCRQRNAISTPTPGRSAAVAHAFYLRLFIGFSMNSRVPRSVSVLPTTGGLARNGHQSALLLEPEGARIGQMTLRLTPGAERSAARRIAFTAIGMTRSHHYASRLRGFSSGAEKGTGVVFSSSSGSEVSPAGPIERLPSPFPCLK